MNLIKQKGSKLKADSADFPIRTSITNPNKKTTENPVVSNIIDKY
ncbi:hypothetical protein [Chryseobacterium sp. CCH4-E10]|nr:hypothetical protein [Chryseobacterium sp. CCH4-E10]